MILRLFYALPTLLHFVHASQLIVIYADGFGGAHLHQYLSLNNNLKALESNGLWSDMVIGVFPTHKYPTLQSLITGRYPTHHGFVADQFYSETMKTYFLGGTSATDLNVDWWKAREQAPPIWHKAGQIGARVALVNWPLLCNVEALYDRPDFCQPYDETYMLSNNSTLAELVALSKKNDLTFIYDDSVVREALSIGVDEQHSPKRRQSNAIARLLDTFGALTQLAQYTHRDMNVLLLSGRGMMDVPSSHQRFLEDHVDMDLIENTVGAGALKHLFPKSGMEFKLFDLLRSKSVIPNIKVYRTDARQSDMPNWYWHYRNERIPPLILVAQPGYVIRTKMLHKQVPAPSNDDYRRSASGYNNMYPDMMGTLLAYGPGFVSGVRATQLHWIDIHQMMCALTRIPIDNEYTDGYIERVKRYITVTPIYASNVTQEARVRDATMQRDVVTTSYANVMTISYLCYLSLFFVHWR